MNINIIDIIIVLIALLGGIIGFKNGAIKEGVHLVGIILTAIIAFVFKDSLMVVLYENLPFYNFFGIINGITAINILFYQLISFLIIFAALFFLLRVLLVITGLVEWLVKITVFLKWPSKILGIFVGMIEYAIYIFIVLFILNTPIFNLGIIADSKLANEVLQRTPILSNLVSDTVTTYANVWTIVRNKDNNSSKEVNTLVLATLLDQKLISVESAKELVEANKIDITDPTILDEYTDEDSFYKIVKEKIPPRPKLNKKKTT